MVQACEFAKNTVTTALQSLDRNAVVLSLYSQKVVRSGTVAARATSILAFVGIVIVSIGSLVRRKQTLGPNPSTSTEEAVSPSAYVELVACCPEYVAYRTAAKHDHRHAAKCVLLSRAYWPEVQNIPVWIINFRLLTVTLKWSLRGSVLHPCCFDLVFICLFHVCVG